MFREVIYNIGVFAGWAIAMTVAVVVAQAQTSQPQPYRPIWCRPRETSPSSRRLRTDRDALSEPNPGEENAPARATWQSSVDTSAVWAKKTAESSDPAFVAPGSIPWFLLQAAGARNGPMGGATLAQTTFIQRVNTAGCVMPTTACTEAGVLEFVPYAADYHF